MKPTLGAASVAQAEAGKGLGWKEAVGKNGIV